MGGAPCLGYQGSCRGSLAPRAMWGLLGVLSASGWALGGNVGSEQSEQCLCLTRALLWFVAHAEAGQVPRAGCPGPSPSAGAGRPGSPQGALCATAGAGATAGSASVT